jgi:hypothetical protein
MFATTAGVMAGGFDSQPHAAPLAGVDAGTEIPRDAR